MCRPRLGFILLYHLNYQLRVIHVEQWNRSLTIYAHHLSSLTVATQGY